MKRSLWVFFLWLCCATATLATPHSPLVDLDDGTTVNLLPGGRYLLDTGSNLTLDSALDAGGWQPLGREQLRFGMEKTPVWLDLPFHTSNALTSMAVLVLNRVIDNVDVRLYANDVQRGEWHQGAFLARPGGITGTNKNVFTLDLQPDQDYRLLLRIQGHNALTGPVELYDKENYHANDEVTLFVFIAYGMTVLAIALYNIIVYLSSGLRAFVYHAVYGLCILLLQATQYGYLDSLLHQHGGSYSKGVVILFACNAAYSAVLGLFFEVVSHRQEPLFNRGLQLVVLGSILIILVSPFIDLHTGLSLFVVNVCFGVLLGLAHLAYLAYYRERRFWQLLIMLSIFSPSSVMLILSRFGVVNNTFWAENWILMTVIAEMLLLSGILFKRIQQMRLSTRRARLEDPRNYLPNILALQEQLDEEVRRGQPHALSYCWLGGLEKMEIARGSEFRNQYLRRLAALLGTQLQLEGFSLPTSYKKQEVVFIFYCENNTLALITLPLDADEHQRLQQMLIHVFEQMKLEYGYNFEINPVIASNNANLSGKDGELTIQNVNVALSQCIQAGKSLLLYNDDVGYNERRQIALLNDFEEALQQNQFYLQWQPQFDPLENRLQGLEALVRWRHPWYGELSPVQFIPLLEQNSMITQLSLWVVRQVFTLSPVFFRRFPQLDVSINLSVYDLMSEKFFVALDTLLAATPQDVPPHIIMEVTESVHMEDNARVRQAVEALQTRGFRISIDDFGAGYASFGYLQTLPANELKIDKRYTDSCHEASSQAIIRSIIDLASRLKMQIVVEGIEHQHQQELFTDWGVHRLQGWRLGKPATQEEILADY